MRVGRPESPGFFQYVCQCGAMRSCSPRVMGWPGCAETRSEMRRASTCSVLTTGAAQSGHASMAAARAVRYFMLWIKSLHIVFMVSWFAGLFYLPRLFVYHASAEDSVSRERFKVMERK